MQRTSQHRTYSNMPSSRLLLAAAAVLLLSAAPAAGAEDHDFSYIPGTPTGPENWGNLRPEWATCGNGQRQTPINLDLPQITLVPGLGHLHYRYKNVDASVVNKGHDITVRFDGDAGKLVLNGMAYHLRQVHWHTPSEHSFDGNKFAMELHMVHFNARNQAAVIGILYDVGSQPDRFLYKLEPYIRRIAKQKGKEEPVTGGVDPNIAIDHVSASYFRYMGSFTTPPCTEGVIWTLIPKVRSVSREQLALLKKAVLAGFENNARPLQDVNGREIGLFLPRRLDDLHDVY